MSRPLVPIPIYTAASLGFVSLVSAMNPAARWGHQAVYVPSQQAMYVVGGQTQQSTSQITNEVLILSVRHSLRLSIDLTGS